MTERQPHDGDVWLSRVRYISGDLLRVGRVCVTDGMAWALETPTLLGGYSRWSISNADLVECWIPANGKCE